MANDKVRALVTERNGSELKHYQELKDTDLLQTKGLALPNMEVFEATVDPQTTGVAAPLNSVCYFGEHAYKKTTAPDTGWVFVAEGFTL